MKEKEDWEEAGTEEDIFLVPPSDLFKAFLEQTPDRVYIKDHRSRFVRVSRTMLDVFGLESQEDLIGKTDFDFFTPEHAQQAYDDEREILRTGRPIICKEEKETWRDGTETWASSTKAPLFLASGQIAGLLGISRDITEHRQNEQRVLEQNAIMSRDMESARNVQAVMIPGEIPGHPSVDTAVWLRPMAAVGGDCVTYPADPEGRMLFFLGDVAGHGVSAALFTVLLKYLADRRGDDYTGDPGRFLNEVNQDLGRRIPDGFVTGLAGHFEETASGVDLLVANAGHADLLVFRRREGLVERIHLNPGAVMGLELEAASAPDRIPLLAGDRVYVFTDGLVEACNRSGEEFGIERVLSSAQSIGECELQAALESLAAAAARHRQGLEQQDDVTILGFEVTDSESRA
jgi:phosphoserine phosphatase RsbU/P